MVRPRLSQRSHVSTRRRFSDTCSSSACGRSGYAAALARAVQRLADRVWTSRHPASLARNRRLPADPEDAARDTHRAPRGRRRGRVPAVALGLDSRLGARRYDPIYDACSRTPGLPLLFHAGTVTSPVFPVQTTRVRHRVRAHSTSHTFSYHANIIRMVSTGGGALPEFKIGVTGQVSHGMPFVSTGSTGVRRATARGAVT